MLLQQVAKAVGLLLDTERVVLDVAQVAALLVVAPADACISPSRIGDERLGGALELDHLAGELVDAARDGGAAVEDVVLDLVDVVLDAGDHRRVVVDDAVEDRVHDRERPAAEQVGARLEARGARGAGPAPRRGGR